MIPNISRIVVTIKEIEMTINVFLCSCLIVDLFSEY